MSQIFTKSDAIFINELEKGYQHQEYIAQLLRNKGFNAYVDILRIRGNKTEIDKYQDNGDIIVITKKPSKVILEVKSRNIAFTSPEDYPYDTAFIDRRTSWDRKCNNKTKPHAIILISQITKGIVVVPVTLFDQWIIDKKYDHVRNFTKEYYMCPKEILKSFDEMVEWLTQKN